MVDWIVLVLLAVVGALNFIELFHWFVGKDKMVTHYEYDKSIMNLELRAPSLLAISATAPAALPPRAGLHSGPGGLPPPLHPAFPHPHGLQFQI
jgi:hypothetical protein